MCEYCKNGKQLLPRIIDMDGYPELAIESGELFFDNGNDEAVFKINNCPMCGRDLRGAMRDGGLHSAPFTAGLWCDGCRFFGIHGLREGRIVDSVGYTCSRPELQRPPQEFRHISPGEIDRCYYREEAEG